VEEKLKKMTEMLLAGGKMLGVHCGKCLGPLFEFQGKVVCPVCGGQTRPAGPEAGAPPLKRVEEVLHAKINSLAEQLAGETDHARTLELLERIKSALEALEKLKKG
jgi:UPF0148 protein